MLSEMITLFHSQTSDTSMQMVVKAKFTTYVQRYVPVLRVI
jgi:hypothetical protein